MSYTYTHGAKKHTRRNTILLLVILATIGGGAFGVNRQFLHGKTSLKQPQQSHNIVEASKNAQAVPASTNYSLPVRLQIPKLQVDARVIYVGVNKTGNMKTPDNVTDTGWYKYSALPGNTGTAVIAGHLDGLRGEPGVFSNIKKLVAGDAITVTENNGIAATFVVRESRSYPQNDQPTEVFSSASGAHLNLITCTGSWDSTEHKFAQRLVVFADKAS